MLNVGGKREIGSRMNKQEISHAVRTQHDTKVNEEYDIEEGFETAD